MRKSKIASLLFITLLSNILYSDNSLPKLFGLKRGDEKKCILLSTNNISLDLAPVRAKILFPDGVAESKYIEQTLKKLNIDCIQVIPKSFYDRIK